MRHAGPVNVGDGRRRFRVLPPQVLESLPYYLEPLHSRAPQLITQIAVEIQNTCNFLTVEAAEVCEKNTCDGAVADKQDVISHALQLDDDEPVQVVID